VTGVAFIAILAAMSARAASLPALLMLPLDMVDTSGETPSRAKEHEDRLKVLAPESVERTGRGSGLLDHRPDADWRSDLGSPIDTAPGGMQWLRTRPRQTLRVDRVLVGRVDKISTLIGDPSLRIVDVQSGRIVFGRTISFRGDTDEAWQRAARFFVRYPKEIPLGERYARRLTPVLRAYRRSNNRSTCSSATVGRRAGHQPDHGAVSPAHCELAERQFSNRDCSYVKHVQGPARHCGDANGNGTGVNLH
jgi:Protein of unknown function (DUF2380)